MRNIKEWLEGFGVDAYIHTLVVIIIAVVVARVSGIFVGHIVSAIVGVAVGLLCGVAKELYDTRKKGFVDVKDYVMPSERCCFWSYIYKHKRK